MRRQRCFAGKARRLQLVDVLDYFDVDRNSADVPQYLMLVKVAYAEGEPDSFCIPLTLLIMSG